MNSISIYQPCDIQFGTGVIRLLPDKCQKSGYKKICCLFASPLKLPVENLYHEMQKFSIRMERIEYSLGEPTTAYFNDLLNQIRTMRPDCIVGIGGGSVLDLAKLAAALWNSAQTIEEIFGKNLLKPRTTGLICIPTTSGTGSEVSPNAILLDESDSEKKSVISPYLIPDSCYIDPELIAGLPPKITAETAMDALSHCIEAYTNKFSHPVADIYALAGIKLIMENLEAAYQDGTNLEARSALALGSMYGGYCLGPVNTAAVHALSYGLGGKYHIPHGLANAILLPKVMRFNLDAVPDKYLSIAKVMGADSAEEGIVKIETLAGKCGIPQKLSDIGVKQTEVENLTNLAMKVTRLLVNNPKEVTRQDAINIYNSLF